MKLPAKVRELADGGVVHDVLRLVSGTLGGRAIAIAAMPIITRLYSPDDFALLAVYLAIVNMGGAIACLRLDVAIPVARDDKDAAHLLILALTLAFCLATTLLIATFVAPSALAAEIGQPRLAPWLWMVPLGILMTANYSALQFWATRMRRFGSIAVTRVTQAATGAITTIATGLAGITPLGLLVGSILNTSSGGLRLGRDAVRINGEILRSVTRPGLATAFRAYRRFPIYSTPEALANLAGIQVPVMIIAGHAGGEAGYLLLAQQVIAIPMTLLGSSIAQVYVSRAPDQRLAGTLHVFTLSILRRLALIGVAPLILAGLLAPHIFPVLFGPEWGRAGEIVSWMVPWAFLQFLASPISQVMFVTSRQRAMLALTLFGGTLRIGAVLVASTMDRTAMVPAYVCASAIFYGTCLLIFTWASGAKITPNLFIKGPIYILAIFLYLLYLIFV